MSERNFQKMLPHLLGVILLLSGLLAQAGPAPASAAGVVDLVIAEVQILPDLSRFTNEDTIVRVTIRNQGSARAENFFLDAYIDRLPDTCADFGDYYYFFPGGLDAGAEITQDVKIRIEDIQSNPGWIVDDELEVNIYLGACFQGDEIKDPKNTYDITTQIVNITPPAFDPPVNDEFADATLIMALPFSVNQNVKGATLNTETDKNVSQCQLVAGAKSVWYQYQPVSDTSVIFDTFTSDYDTYIAVWTGTPDALTEIVCNDDARSTKQSQVVVRMTGGTTYYIQVAEYRFNLAPAPMPEAQSVSERPAMLDALSTKPGDDAGAQATVGTLNFRAYIDNIPPTVVSIKHGGPSATLASSVDYIVTFSEPVEQLGAGDFSLTATGTLAGFAITGFSGDEDVYTVTVNTGNGVGTLRLDVSGSAIIEDIVGNKMQALPYITGAVYKVRVQTFSDVPTAYWSWQFIEQLASAGVTGGCGTAPLRYCPGTVVTRDQMAIFLLRGINGSTYAPPPVGSSTGFVDVPTTYWAAAWIKQLAAAGITGGCGGGKYCPANAVTRDQMAIFLLRAKYGSTYAPPPVGASTGFADVPTTHWAAAWIKQLAAEGITGGCGGGNYCPGNPVTRDQMAVFLVRAFKLP